MRLAPYRPERARIEIVPMIDTIFFLLVFFMVASVSLSAMQGMPVSLPRSTSAVARHVETVVLTMDSQGRCFVDRQLVPTASMSAEIRKRLRKAPGAVVVLNCDEQRDVGDLVRLADAARAAGARSLTIATRPGGAGED